MFSFCFCLHIFKGMPQPVDAVLNIAYIYDALENEFIDHDH
jgi:hypothetical protein